MSPQAVVTHHPGRLACAIDAPEGPAATMAPMIATPSEIPTRRLVDAIAAATPACAAGMPDTAVLVIGGVTIPKPHPKTREAISKRATGVAGSSPGSMRLANARPAPPATSDVPGP